MNEYQRQRKRISSIKSRLKRQGYNVAFNIPKNKGKKYTQSDIDELAKITVSDVLRPTYEKELKKVKKRISDLEKEGLTIDTTGLLDESNTISRKDINNIKSLNKRTLRTLTSEVDDEQNRRFRYEKEKKRIEKELNKLESEGFNTEIIKHQISNKETVTEKDIEALKIITKDVIEDNSYKYDDDIGLQINKTTDKKQYDSESKNGVKIGIYKSNWKYMIGMFPEKAEPYLSRVETDLINMYGEEQIYIAINKAMNDGFILSPEIAYSEERLTNFARGLLTYFNYGFDSEYEELVEEIVHFQW